MPLVKSKAQSFSFPAFEFDYEDLYQVALIGLWKAYDHYDIERSRVHFGYYASIVIVTELSIYYRKNTKEKRHNVTIASLNAPIDFDRTILYLDSLADEMDIIENIIDNLDLENSISKLKEEDRKIIKDCFYDDMSRNEISKKMKLSKQAVSKRMKKAIANLSKQYINDKK